MTFDKILETIINVVFGLFGNAIKGYKTVIVAVATFLLGLWQFLGDGLFVFLCDTSAVFEALVIFCNIQETQFYAAALIVIGLINTILRRLTDTPIGVASLSRTGYEELTRKKKWAWVTIPLGVVGFVVIATAVIFGVGKAMSGW